MSRHLAWGICEIWHYRLEHLRFTMVKVTERDPESQVATPLTENRSAQGEAWFLRTTVGEMAGLDSGLAVFIEI